MNEEEQEEVLIAIEGFANFLRGLRHESNIREDQKQALESIAKDIDRIIDRFA